MQIIETKEIQKTMAEKIQELELEIKELKKVRNRSSHRRFSVKKVFLEIWQNSQENICARVSFFNKVAGLRPTTLLKKRLWHRRFPVNYAKFLKIPFFIEHLWWLLLTKRRFMYCILAQLVYLVVRKSLVANYLLR